MTKRIFTEIEIQKTDFIKIFSNNIDKYDDRKFKTFVLNSDQNRYIGHVDFDGFNIRRKKQFWNWKYDYAFAKGSFKQNGNILQIETEISFNHPNVVSFILLLVFDFYILFSVFFKENSIPTFLVFFLLIQVVIFLGIPYLVTINGMNYLQMNLEQDFISWVKRNNL